MDNRILIEMNYEGRIRSIMGVSEPYLPNEDINQPDIITVAEANIISQITSYATLKDDARTYLESAVVLECCVLLSPSMAARLPKKETGPHAGHELWIDWTKKKIEFEEERNSYIYKIYDLIELPYPSLPHFTVTYPKRGW